MAARVKSSPSFTKSTSELTVYPSIRPSKKSIDLLEAITAPEIAMSQPYLRIWQLNAVTHKPYTDRPPLTFYFVKPPSFGSSITSSILSERPPVSLERFSLKTKQNYGINQIEQVTIDVVVHRPDAIFDTNFTDILSGKEQNWSSLLTPGVDHIIEYGWTSASKNNIMNGNGVFDETTGTVTPARKIAMFSTMTYNFDIQNDGQIRLKINGVNSSTFMARTITIGDIAGLDKDRDRTEVTKKKRSPKDKTSAKAIFKALQSKLDLLDGTRKRQLFSFEELMNKFVAETVTSVGSDWGYNKYLFQFSDFNIRTGSTRDSKENGGKKSYGQVGGNSTSIGDFLFTRKFVLKTISKLSEHTTMSLASFMQAFASAISRANWHLTGQGKKSIDYRIPDVKARVQDLTLGKDRVLNIIIFDQNQGVHALADAGKLKVSEQTTSKIKTRVNDAGIPYVRLGQSLSYIKSAQFKADIEGEVQRNKILQAYKKARQSKTSSSDVTLRESGTDIFHEMFSSAIVGEITMLGNFVFDTFALLWIDTRVTLWSGVFIITAKEDVLTRASFETKVTVRADGSDPLNTRRLLPDDYIDEELIKKRKELERQRDKVDKRKRSRSGKRRRD